jgi:lipid-binding SYLF domain-containing protein
MAGVIHSEETRRSRLAAKRRPCLSVALLLVLVLATLLDPHPTVAASAAEIDRDAREALQTLFESTPQAKDLAPQAKAILVFPSVFRAGLVIGGLYGEGALMIEGRTVGYYSIGAGSFGLQAGVQAYGYALFFMNSGALRYLDDSSGWELGTGYTVVMVDKGDAAVLSTSTAFQDIYAFIFDQTGLMAGIGLQGSKITKINPQ